MKRFAFLSLCGLLSAGSPGLAQECVGPAAGLVAWWRGEDSAGSVLGGTGNAGRIGYAEGRVGRAFLLEQSGDGVELGTPAFLDVQEWSVDAWVRRSASDRIAADEGEVGWILTRPGHGFRLGIRRDGRLVFAGPGGTVVSDAGLATDGFHHVAWIRSGGQVRFLVDGVEAGSGAAAGWLGYRLPAVIGRHAGDGTGTFLGVIDELAFHDRALLVEEVAAVHAAGGVGRCALPADVANDIGAGTERLIQASNASGNLMVTSDGFANEGVLRLESRQSSLLSGLTVEPGALTNRVGGEIQIRPGSGGARALNASIFNDGLWSITQPLTVTRPWGRIVNTADLSMSGSGSLALSGGGLRIDLVDGSVTGGGQLSGNGISLRFHGGSLTGSPVLVNSRLEIDPANTNAGTFLLTGSGSTLSGSVQAGQEVWMGGSSAGGGTLIRVAEGLTTAGLVRLESRNSGFESRLAVEGGPLRIRSGGEFRVAAGNGGSRSLAAQVENDGLLDARESFPITASGGVHVNRGEIRIASGKTLSWSGSNQRFLQESGSIRATGQFDFSGMEFEYRRGELEGTLYFLNSDLRLESFGPETWGLIASGSGTRVRGWLNTGQSLWLRGDSRGGGTTIRMPDGFTNRGTLRMESANSGFVTHLEVSNGILLNAREGQVLVRPGAGGTRSIAAEILNEGEVNLLTSTTVGKADAVHRNRGTWSVGAGSVVTVSGAGQTFRQETGLLDLAGGGDFTDITFRYDGGEIKGVPLLDNVRLFIGPGTGPVEFTMTRTGSRLEGNVASGQVIRVQGSSRGGATTLVATKGLTNSGVIRVQSANSGFLSALTVDGGAFLNRPDGLLLFGVGTGGPRTLTAELQNEGELRVSQSMTLVRSGATHVNRGRFIIDPGQTWTMSGQGQIFRQEAGLLELGGAADLSGITFEYLGGDVVGTPYLDGVDLRLGEDAVRPVSLVLARSSSRVRGTLKDGQNLWIRSDSRVGSTVVSAPDGFTNAGVLRLEALNAGYTVGFSTGTNELLNLPGGRIWVRTGAGGPRSLTGPLVNLGTVDMEQGMTLGPAGTTHRNAGGFNIAAGQTLTLPGASQRFLQEGGTLRVQGGFQLDDDTFRYAGGVVEGSLLMTDSRLELPASAGPGGEFLFRGTGVVTGSVPAQVRLVVEGSAARGGGLLQLPSGLVNAGRLTLVTRNSSYNVQVQATGGSLVNSHTGVIEIQAGSGGTRRIQAGLIHRGLLDLQHSARIGTPAEGILSEGRILVRAGTTLTVDGGLQLQRGRLEGAGVIAGTVVSEAVTAPGPGIGTLQVQGPWRQGGRGILDLEIGPDGNDQLRVTGLTELGGTVRVRFLPGHVAAAGNRHVLLQSPVPVGRPTLDLPVLPSGLGWRADYSAGLALEVVELAVNDPAVGIAGTIRGPDGQPAPEVPVQVIDRNQPGLLAEYWNGTNRVGSPVLSRIEPVLEQRWGTAAPGSGVGKPFLTRWTGEIIAPLSGRYRLHVTGDDGIRLWIGDDLLIDRWTGSGGVAGEAEFDFEAGQSHPIRVEHYDTGGAALAVLEWSGPSIPRQVVPSSALRAPLGAATVLLNQWTIRTDAAGRYEVALAPGRWQVVPAGLGDLGFQSVEPRTVLLSHAVAVVDFDLEPAVQDRFPDLAVSQPTAPATAVAGGTITVNWTTSNHGEAAARGPWREIVLLGNQPSGFGAVEIGRIDVASDLAAGASIERSLAVVIPVGRTGPHFLLVRVDSTGAVDEGDSEDNNLGVPRGVNLLIGDLVVERVEAPVSAAWGDGVEVTWVVRNVGGAAVSSSWTDTLYLSASATGGTILTNVGPAHAGALAPGAAYTNTVRIQLPLGGQNAPGTRYFLVRTDRTGLQPEANESNNLGVSAPVNVNRPPPPDLVVTSVEVPALVEAGRPVTVRWIVRNNGSSPAVGPWKDTVFLLPGPVVVTQVGFNDFLEPGAEVVRTRDILFPATLAGVRTVGITTDADDQVFESGDADNNTATAVGATTLAAPDLVALSVQVNDAVAGTPFPVEWTVRNGGNLAAAGVWRDRLTLVGPGGSTVLGVHLRPGTAPVPASTTYTQSVPVTVPLTADSVPGEYRLRLEVDSRGELGESDESNQQVESAVFRLGLPALPDLTVRSVTTPPGAAPGQSLPLVWELANAGEADVAAGILLRLELLPESPSPVRTLLSFRLAAPIPAGGVLAGTSTVTLPITSAGRVHFGVVADAANEVVESNESNNIGRTESPVEISRQLVWNVPVATIPENVQPPLIRARLTRSGPVDTALTVNLTSGDTNEVVLPATIGFAAGAATVELDLAIQADGRVDGPKPTLLTAEAAGFNPGYFTLTVLDADRARLTLMPETNRVVEGRSIPVRIRRSEPAVEDLQINLSTSAGELAPPPTVILPAGAEEVSFALIAQDNDRLEPARTVILTAGAEEHLASSVEITVLDNDDPGLVVSVDPGQIGEGDGPLAAVGTLVRSHGVGRLLRVRMNVSNPARLVVAPELVFAPGQSTLNFFVGPVDDRDNNGPAEVTVTASVVAPLTGEVLATSAPASVTVQDDDGPALRLSLGATVVREGRSPAFTAVVLRNSPVNQPLTVQLEVSRPDEAAVPQTVVIPAGQNSVSFPVTTLEDGRIDGNQRVTLTASATLHAPAAASFTVTDGDLPDLAFGPVTASATGVTGGDIGMTFRVINQGFAPARGPFTQRVYLSRDALLDASDVLLEESVFSGTLEAGGHFDRTVTRRLPMEAGEWRVLVVTDALGSVVEVLESNNLAIAVGTLWVEPSYSATVSTPVEVAAAGTAIPLSGRATLPGGEPAVGEWVKIRVGVRGTERTLEALTDAAGRFQATFQPVAGEFGGYTLAASHPGATTPAVQDRFELLGLRVDPAYQFIRVIPARTNVLRMQLTNPNGRGLTGLRFDGAAVDDLGVLVDGPELLAAGETAPVTVRVWSRAERDAVGRFTVRMTSGEGARMDAVFDYTVELPKPRLVVQPARLDLGMVRGRQATAEFRVVNQGGADSGPMDVTLPDLPWLRVASVLPLPSLAPGESATVTLALTPDETVPLGIQDGRLAVGNDQARVGVPFSIRQVSEALGDVRVPVHDENTYYGNGALVAGAAVVLRDVYDKSPVATATTGTNGVVEFIGVPEGTYNLEVSAPRHDTFLRTLQVQPGRVNESVAFLRTQLVRYNWRVEEVEFEERARIRLDTVFETTVPAPVVTIEPSLIDLSEVTGDVHTIEMRITNHGLIAAQSVDLRFEDGATWRVNPLATDLGAIAPKSSITVPVTFTRIDPSEPGPGSDRAAQPATVTRGGGCSVPTVGVGWELVCGPFGVAYWMPVFVVDRSVCPTLPAPYTPGRVQGVHIPSFTPSPPGGPGEGRNLIPVGVSSRGFSSVSSPNDCSCDKDTFVEKCAFSEGGYKGNASAAARSVLNQVLGPVKWLSVQGFEVKFGGSGKICTCCEEVNGQGVVGLKAEADLGGSIEVKLFAGPQFQVSVPDVNIPGLTGATAEMFLGAGVELSGTGSIKLNAKTECFLENPEVYVEARVRIGAPVGLRGTGKVSGKLANGTQVELSAEAFGGIELGAYAYFSGYIIGGSGTPRRDGCVEAINLKAEMKVSGGSDSLSGGYSASVSQEIAPKLCISGAGGSSLPPVAALTDAEIVSQMLGYGSPQALATQVTGRGDAAGSLGEHPTSRELSDQLIRHLGLPRTAAVGAAAVPVFTQTYSSSSEVDAADAAAAEARRNRRRAGVAAGAEEGVCAQVKLVIEQQAVVTRKGIGTFLEIINESTDTPLEDIGVDIQIIDRAGNPANDRFLILPPELTRLQPMGRPPTNQLILGGLALTLPADSTGSARWLIVPLDTAAPEEPVEYFVGGHLAYRSGDITRTAVLTPGIVTVHPNARLFLKYFHQRDVHADDPFTEVVEPSLPFVLGVMVENRGRGVAANFSITSAQPRIVDNAKGLLVHFDILGAEVSGRPIQPTLTASFGNVGPGSVAVGRWLLRSSVQGHFIDYNATLEHDDRFGERGASVFEGVEIHELIRQVEADRAFADGLPDFLANDVEDAEDLPDTLHLSDGSVRPVAVVREAVVSGSPTADQLEVDISAVMPTGWVYLRIPDPARGRFVLREVRRTDGSVIGAPTNAWVTDRTFIGQGRRPIIEPILHLLDHDSTGRYTLVYQRDETLPDTVAPESRVTVLPATSPTPIAVRWTGADDVEGSGVDSYDVFVSVDGGPFERWLTGVRTVSAFYPAAAGRRYAFYTVARDAAGNVEDAPGTPDAVTVAVGNSPPQIEPIADITVDEGSSVEVVVRASDPDLPGDALRFERVSGPAGAVLDPVTGRFTWLTGEVDGPSTRTVRVRVLDDGEPPLSAEREFRVTVREVNLPVVFRPVAPVHSVEEGSLFRLMLMADDPDLPANALRYRLVGTPPSGATLNAVTGEFRWIPSEIQGGQAWRFEVEVTDQGTPPSVDRVSFEVEVAKVNSSPVLAAIGDRTVWEGDRVEIALVASDADLPVQTLVYGLVQGAGLGAAVDPGSGMFTWIPLEPHAAATHGFRVRVTDSGDPVLGAERSFQIQVRPLQPGLNLPARAEDGTVTFRYKGRTGVRAVLQGSTDLIGWDDLTEFVPEHPVEHLTERSSVGYPWRYFRVIER